MGSFAGYKEGGRHNERGGMEQGKWKKDSREGDSNEAQ